MNSISEGIDFFLSIKNFDSYCLDEIFNRAALDHFMILLKYPES